MNSKGTNPGRHNANATNLWFERKAKAQVYCAVFESTFLVPKK
jgi:hypothetical protein